jgi:hypothetical protein
MVKTPWRWCRCIETRRSTYDIQNIIYMYVCVCVCVVFLVWIINFHCQLQGWSYLLLFSMVTMDMIHTHTHTHKTPQERTTKLVLISTKNYSAFGNVVSVHHTTKTEVISQRMLNFGTCWRCVASYPTAFKHAARKKQSLAQNQTPVVFCSRHYTELLRLVRWNYCLAPESAEHLKFNEFKSIMVLYFTVRDMRVHCHSYLPRSI